MAGGVVVAGAAAGGAAMAGAAEAGAAAGGTKADSLRERRRAGCTPARVAVGLGCRMICDLGALGAQRVAGIYLQPPEQVGRTKRTITPDFQRPRSLHALRPGLYIFPSLSLVTTAPFSEG